MLLAALCRRFTSWPSIRSSALRNPTCSHRTYSSNPLGGYHISSCWHLYDTWLQMAHEPKLLQICLLTSLLWQYHGPAFIHVDLTDLQLGLSVMSCVIHCLDMQEGKVMVSPD